MNIWEFLDRNIFTEGFAIFAIIVLFFLTGIIGIFLGK